MNEPAASYPIRTATPDTVQAFVTPVMRAFGEETTDAEFEHWRPTTEPDRVIAAFDGETPIASAGAYTFRLTVPGGEVAAAGVTAVGVDPGYRRQGVLRSLMRRQLDDVRERGEPVAILWASESAIYQRFGYGLGTLGGAFEVERTRTAWLRPAAAGGRMRVVGPEEALAAFPPIYDRVRVETPGAVTRSEDWWRWRVLRDDEHHRYGAGPLLRYLCEVDGVAEGYALYRVKEEWDDRGPRSQLVVVEATAATNRAERTVWSFLFGIDLVRTIRAFRLSMPHPLLLELADPRGLGLTGRDGVWLRLVDMAAALAARRYWAADRIVLEVTDAFCPWNAGRWALETEGEAGSAVARVIRTDAPADLLADVADLAAAYLGAFRPSDLARAARVTELTPGALRRADALFAADRTPWCATGF
jgi:predicted acetyltransferase